MAVISKLLPLKGRNSLPTLAFPTYRENQQHRWRNIWKFQRAAPKVKRDRIDVRVLYAREIFTRVFDVAKLLKRMVARDGIEPPTPAFSGPLTGSQKWFEINRCQSA